RRVSASYARVLGVAPALGTSLDPADDRPGGARTVLLGDGVWRRRFGGDPAIVGRQITLDGMSFTVAGVMPPGFVDALAPSAEVWTTLQYDPALPTDGREWGHHLQMTGRLRAGVDVDDAAREIAAIARAPLPAFARPPAAQFARGLDVRTL